MLQLMRKYQKFFFGIIAIVIIASFCFFGTYGTITSQPDIPDRKIGTLIDDSPIMQQEVDLLVRFMATSPDERQLLEKGQMPNLFNDGVIQKEFMQTGFLSAVAKPWFSELSSELKERVDKARAHRHYVHPQAPFVSAESVWSQFFPAMKTEIEQLKTSQGGTETLRLLGDLYLEQQKMPSDLLRRILMYQQQQYEWMSYDPRLENADLSLFGFQNLEDWLGPTLMRSLAQVILNGAAKAHSEGYHVSEEEARRSLHANFFAGLKKSNSDREMSQQELKNLYQHQIHLLHHDERKIVNLWQKVLEFRKMVNDTGSSVALDASSYQQFSNFAREKIRVNTYGLPEALQLKNFRDLLKLQTYLEAVSVSPGKKPSSSLYLPHLFASPEDMQKRTPELVEYRFSAEIAEVTYDSLASRVSLKQAYDWEMEAKNWQRLRSEFPALAQLPGATVEERYASLEQLEPDLRRRVDKAAREAIVQSHPEWIEIGFAQAERKKVDFGLRQKGGHLPFSGVSDRSSLYSTLKKAPLKGGEADAPATPLRIDTDEYNHYEVVLLKQPSTLTLLTFAEASSDGTLDALLDKKLEEAYSDVRRKNPELFQTESGAWKPLAEVKDYVGAYLYADLLKGIEAFSKEMGVQWPEAERSAPFAEPLDLYALNRLQSHAQQVLEALREGESEDAWIAGQNTARISEQWRLVKKEKEMTRSQIQALQLEDFFDEPTPAWSPVAALQTNQWGFIYALDKRKDEKGDVASLVKAGQEHLAIEARRAVFQALITDIAAKKAIVFVPPPQAEKLL